jgi:hypothetical protein
LAPFIYNAYVTAAAQYYLYYVRGIVKREIRDRTRSHSIALDRSSKEKAKQKQKATLLLSFARIARLLFLLFLLFFPPIELGRSSSNIQFTSAHRPRTYFSTGLR